MASLGVAFHSPHPVRVAEVYFPNHLQFMLTCVAIRNDPPIVAKPDNEDH